ncbi:MAG: hypothetical protein Q9226_004995, partial [Calogaya cf. arnoldii]
MALHDSDSSGEEDEQYATTNVMLGYASEEPTDDIFSHLGGTATWPDDEAPSASLATCKTCNSIMALILQLNGDLPEYLPNHERKLYVFTCRNKPCRRKPGATRAIRGTKIVPSASKPSSQNPALMQNEPLKPSPPTPNLGDSIFNTTSIRQVNPKTNPFSTSTSSKTTPNTNPFSSAMTAKSTPNSQQVPSINDSQTSSPQQDLPLHESFAQKARISTPTPLSTPKPRSPWPSPSLLPQPYPSYHLDADYETLDAPSPKNSPSHNIPSTSSLNQDPPATDEDDDPSYWLSGPAKADKTFLRFAARLAQNPEQVLR